MEHSPELTTWVDEAIRSLGYIKPDAASKIVMLIESNQSIHPRQISTSYRKEGSPLSPDEKKALGIRTNAIMSKEALSDMTAKGLAVPLAAHEQTILRASLSWGRAKHIASEKDMGVSEWECLSPFPRECPGCKRLDGKFMSAAEAVPTGPTDCFREACAISFVPRLDDHFMSQRRRMKTPSQQTSKPWWQFW